jgi:flagellar motor switch protein FliM
MARSTQRTGVPVPYDFRRPNTFSREHQRALQIASETFARQFSTVLSSTLRAVSQVSVADVGQSTYDEYIRDVPNPTYLGVLAMPPLQGSSLLHVPLPLVMTAVDRLLGGTGSGAIPSRPLTEIEDGLVRGLLERVLRELAYAFESLVQIQPHIALQESNPQFAQVAAATDMVILLSFDVRVGSVTGEVTLCLPFTSMQPVLDEVTASSLLTGRPVADPHVLRSVLGDRVGEAPLDVTVRFAGITLPSKRVVALRPGDLVPLGHRVDRPLAVCVEGIDRFAALPGRRGNRLACVVVDADRAPATGAPATTGANR